MNEELKITGEIGQRTDGTVDVLIELQGNSIVWYIDFVEEGGIKYRIHLTDSSVLEPNRDDYGFLKTIVTDDSIHLRVEVASAIREYFPDIDEDYIECCKRLIHDRWRDPLDLKFILAMQALLDNTGGS